MPRSVERLLLLLLAGLLAWQAVDEAILQSQRERRLRSGEAPATVVAVEPSREVTGTSDVLLSYTPVGASDALQVRAHNVVGPPPTVQAPWPHAIMYNPANPIDARVRPPVQAAPCGVLWPGRVVFWSDVGVLAAMCAAAILLWMPKRTFSTDTDESSSTHDQDSWSSSTHSRHVDNRHKDKGRTKTKTTNSIRKGSGRIRVKKRGGRLGVLWTLFK